MIIRLAVDVMGGDHGHEVVIAACEKALQENDQLHLLLVGDQRFINDFHAANSDRTSLVHTTSQVSMDENPAVALRRMPDTSMALALDQLASGYADVMVSAGNTGALIAYSRHKIGMHSALSRPAICTEIPTAKGKTWLLDMGANLNPCTQTLHNFARLGKLYCQLLSGKVRPTIGLLNVGSEMTKGTEQVKQTAELLTADESLNYVGYVEGNDLFAGNVDVVVTDGFTGNVVIKTAQGVADMMVRKFWLASRKNKINRIFFFILRPILTAVGSDMHPAKYNGAPLLGLKRWVVKSHGSASVEGFKNSLLLAATLSQYDIANRLERTFSNI